MDHKYWFQHARLEKCIDWTPESTLCVRGQDRWAGYPHVMSSCPTHSRIVLIFNEMQTEEWWWSQTKQAGQSSSQWLWRLIDWTVIWYGFLVRKTLLTQSAQARTNHHWRKSTAFPTAGQSLLYSKWCHNKLVLYSQRVVSLKKYSCCQC